MLRKILLYVLCGFFMMNAAQAVEYHDSDGKLVPTASMKGKWVIVNYWAAWCRACMVEIPELNNFYQHHTDKSVVIYGVNYDQLSPEDLKEAVHQTNIQFPVLQEDPIHMLESNDIEVLPTTYIVNPKGDVVQKILGPSTAKDLQDRIRDLQKK